MSAKITILLVFLLVIAGSILWYFNQRSGGTAFLPSLLREGKVGEELSTSSDSQEEINMKLESPAFLNEQNIPVKYTCDGENVSPALKISDVSQEAKSLALIMDDPDAPAGTWLHWTIWNISPTTTQVAEASIPEGAVEGLTDFGRAGYGGPCPPSGTHRYFFKLFALDVMLELAPSTELGELEAAMEGHILEQTELIGLYAR